MADIFAPGLLKGQVAVVTGGGTGIGRGIALELARSGADLVIAARRLDRLEAAAEEIRALGVRCLVVQTDVRVREQVQNMVDRTVAEFGRLDIMVNNAAGNFNVKAEDLSPNGFNSVIQIDLYGTFNCSQLAGEVMRRQKYGRIINILTSFLWNTSPGAVHAHSAKAGVWAMTQTLATEWARYGINVNAIAPGPFVVETAAEHWGRTEDDQRRNAARLPVGRMGRVEEMGWVAVFLASPAGDFICGETIVIDGGRKVFLGGGSHPDWVYDRSEGPASNTFSGPAAEGV
ncbi:MAG: SDR family oxidoreductase, partial [Chloroflexi bacterium]|nr:SDR family oxidoreductase [Chloroflexota bacterium]